MRNNLTRAMQLVGIDAWNKMSSEERRNLLSGVKAKSDKVVESVVEDTQVGVKPLELPTDETTEESKQKKTRKKSTTTTRKRKTTTKTKKTKE